MEKHEFHRLIEVLGRIAKATETLAEEPKVEIDAGPPVCPNCQKYNPAVRTDNESGEGGLAEYVMVMQCLNCNHMIYGAVESYVLYADKNSLMAYMEERAAQGVTHQR